MHKHNHTFCGKVCSLCSQSYQHNQRRHMQRAQAKNAMLTCQTRKQQQISPGPAGCQRLTSRQNRSEEHFCNCRLSRTSTCKLLSVQLVAKNRILQRSIVKDVSHSRPLSVQLVASNWLVERRVRKAVQQRSPVKHIGNSELLQIQLVASQKDVDRASQKRLPATLTCQRHKPQQIVPGPAGCQPSSGVWPCSCAAYCRPPPACKPQTAVHTLCGHPQAAPLTEQAVHCCLHQLQILGLS